MSLQSVAHFTSRALDFGLTKETLAKLKEKGLDTLGGLAFACAVMPGAEGVSTELFNTSLVVPVFGEAAATEGHPQVPCIEAPLF